MNSLIIFFLIFGGMQCAESESFHNYQVCLEDLLEDLKMNIWNVGVVAEFKHSLDTLYEIDSNILLVHLNENVLQVQSISIIHKYMITALYALYPTFSNFKVFEPLSKPLIDENKLDIFLAMSWIAFAVKAQDSQGLERREVSESPIYVQEYRELAVNLFGYLKERANFNDLHLASPDKDNLIVIFKKFKANPEIILTMAIFENIPVLHRIIVFLHLNPDLNQEDFVKSPIVKGFFVLGENDSIDSLNFLNQAIGDLENHNIILLSETFTDIVKELLQAHSWSKSKSLFSSILL
jgi:hypothetical protein